MHFPLTLGIMFLGMSAESSGMSTMNGMKLPHTGQSKAKASTSAYLLDQLLMVNSYKCF